MGTRLVRDKNGCVEDRDLVLYDGIRLHTWRHEDGMGLHWPKTPVGTVLIAFALMMDKFPFVFFFHVSVCACSTVSVREVALMHLWIQWLLVLLRIPCPATWFGYAGRTSQEGKGLLSWIGIEEGKDWHAYTSKAKRWLVAQAVDSRPSVIRQWSRLTVGTHLELWEVTLDCTQPYLMGSGRVLHHEGQLTVVVV